jgi:hypothetical protein
VQNIIKLDNTLIAVCGSTLPSFANSSKGEVIQLAAKGSKRCMVEVARQYLSLDTSSIVNNNSPKQRLSIVATLTYGAST